MVQSRYYVIQVRSGSEAKIKEIFLKAYPARFRNLNAEVILPPVAPIKSCPKLSKKRCKSLLPGYLILKCSRLTDDLYYALKGIYGVTRVFRINIYYQEIMKFLCAYQERLAVFAQRIEYVKKRADAKGAVTVSFKSLSRSRQAVKVNFPRKRVIPASCRIRCLLN